MTSLDPQAAPAPVHGTAKMVRWINGLTALALIVAVVVLALTDQSADMGTVLGIGGAARAAQRTTHISIRVRRSPTCTARISPCARTRRTSAPDCL
ncbi:hypothetical protein ACIHIX_39330 [Streptomyces sp. NPDC051913]|uniref:hypothetical protein n=1 Tax=Streptomyces sp. NPDC051913 TaxID=3365676 RepID=UPI0037CD3FAF